MSRDDDVKQAIGMVARIGGFTVKKISTSDDLKERTLTITLAAPSAGWVQERLDFEDIPAQLAVVDGINGHVESVTTLQPGDLAETEAAANAEIAAAAEELPEAPDNDEPRDPDQPLVGELAAAAKQNRRR